MANHLAGAFAFKSKTGVTYTHSACGKAGPASDAWQVAPSQPRVAELVTCKACRRTALFQRLIAQTA